MDDRDRNAARERPQDYSAKADCNCVRNSKDVIARRKSREGPDGRAQRMSWQNVVRVPDDGYFKTDRRSRHHQTGTNTVRMNESRVLVANDIARVVDNSVERKQVLRDPIKTPREPRMQRRQATRPHAGLFCQLHHGTVRGTDDDGLVSLAIDAIENHQQHALGAADQSRVVVEQNLHLRL